MTAVSDTPDGRDRILAAELAVTEARAEQRAAAIQYADATADAEQALADLYAQQEEDGA